MKRAVAGGAIALIAAAGLVTVADGQSAVPPESGTFTYDLLTRFDNAPSPTSNPGVNPARPRDPDRRNPADINARTGRIYVNGELTGRSHAVLTWTYLGRGRQQRGAGLIIKVVEDFGGNDTLIYAGLENNDSRETRWPWSAEPGSTPEQTEPRPSGS